MNSVDSRGLCHHCGWQAADTQAYNYLADDGAPSLGETRAAVAPVIPGAPTPPTAGPRVAPTPPPTQPTRVTRGPAEAPAFCGTCGARLEDGQGFCGQCGSPVSGVGPDGAPSPRIGAGLTVASPIGPPPASGPARYRIGDPQNWSDADAQTEMFTEAAPLRAPYGSGGGTRGRVATPPYGASRGYGPDYAAPRSAPSSSSRSIKMLFGVLCVIGGLISAIAAIVLAISTFH